jgi:hypothetical protein
VGSRGRSRDAAAPVVLPGAGHVPWLDAPGDFACQLRESLPAAWFIAANTEHADAGGLTRLTLIVLIG